MNATLVLLAALSAAEGPGLADFTLDEQPVTILRRFKEEPHVAVSRAGQFLQFHGASHSHGCDDSRQWVFFFDPAGQLVSVTRNLESPAALATLLPKKTAIRQFQTGEGYPVLRATLPGGRELIAAGARSTADPVLQIQLMRSSDVPRLYPGLRAVP